MTYDAGSARATYILDIQDAQRKADQLRALYQGIAQSAQQAARAGGAAAATSASDQARAERAILARAAAEARLAQVQNTGKNTLAGLIQAEQIYAVALAKVDQNSLAAIRTQTQLASVQNRIAGQAGGGLASLPRTLEAFGGEALSQIGAGLAGIAGPAAIAAAGISAVRHEIESFGEARGLVVQLEQTRQSIALQLQGVRNVRATMAEAQAFGEAYKLTQDEINTSVRESLPVLRESRASITQTLSVLGRLRVRNPREDTAGAARAVAELQAGQVQSLVDRFNLPRSEANQLKDAIAQGGDAVVLLDRYLNRLGITNDALKIQTQGASGALRDQARAEEELQIAKGQLATSPAALFMVRAETEATRLYANVLGANNHALDAAANSAFGWLNSLTGLQIPLADVTDGADANARAVLRSADADDRAAAASGRYAAALGTLAGAGSLIPRRLGPLGQLGQGLGGGAAGVAAQVFGQFNRLADAQLGLDLARARTAAQRVALLQRELARTVDPVERLRLQAQIEQERNSAAKTYGGELTKQLRTQESIYDALNKQRDAALGLLELQIRDRQEARKEARQLAGLARVVNGGQFSAEQRAAAQDQIDLIRVQQQQRQQKIRETSATAGGTISATGQLLQSVAGGGVPAAPAPPGAAARVAGGGGVGVPAGGVTVTINLAIDRDGQVRASADPGTVVNLQLQALRGASAAGT